MYKTAHKYNDYREMHKRRGWGVMEKCGECGGTTQTQTDPKAKLKKTKNQKSDVVEDNGNDNDDDDDDDDF